MGTWFSRSTDTEAEVLEERILEYLEKSGKYRHIEFLAQGEFGWVSRVYDDKAGKSLVMKCTSHNKDMELSWWPKLDHPNILPLYEIITIEKFIVFIMPSMRKDLRNVVKNSSFYKDGLSFSLSRVWLRDVANALAYLHGKFLCHLNLKLDNVFLKEDRSVCLGDFSFLSDIRKVPADIFFLPVYDPPEWFNNVQMPKSINTTVGDKADMWQYGILAVDLLCNLGIAVSNYSEYTHWSVLEMISLYDLTIILEETFLSVVFKQEEISLCHHFLQNILVLKPEQRISADEAMVHPFLEIECPAASTLPTVVDGDRPELLPLPNEEIEDPSMTVEEVMAAAAKKEGKKEYLPDNPSKGNKLLEIKPVMPFPGEGQIFDKKPHLDKNDTVRETR